MFKKISLFLTSLVFVLTTIGSTYAVTLKASHQWPGTPRADGSFDPKYLDLNEPQLIKII